ncbi:MAG TPA: hypothetical protein VEI74_09970 [Candidatus Methylomirabilis sp.]|nr:hypothetical protein [Candidatus Methylomirabilis sp.]
MNPHHDTEDRQILARCAVCQVERCADCDTVHLHIGHASLRLTTAAFLSLCATLLEAAQTATQSAVVPAAPRRAAN